MTILHCVHNPQHLHSFFYQRRYICYNNGDSTLTSSSHKFLAYIWVNFALEHLMDLDKYLIPYRIVSLPYLAKHVNPYSFLVPNF